MINLIAITLTSQTDAEAVRDALLQRSQEYQYVSVSDYLGLVGINPTHLDELTGWGELKEIPIKQVGEDEFMLELPEPKSMRLTENRSKQALKKDLEQESRFLSALQMKHDGYSNSAIARQLGISESSVRTLLKP